MMRTLLSTVAPVMLGASLAFGPSAAVAETQLPTANCGLGPTNNCLVFGDFTVYSLPYLQEVQRLQNTDLAGQLQNSLQGLNLVAKPNQATVDIISTNAQGTAAQGSGKQIDDPYDARSGSSSGAESNLMMLMVSGKYGGQYSVPSDPAGGPGSRDNILKSSSTVLNTNTFIHDPSQTDLAHANDYAGNCFSNLDGCLSLWDADVSALRSSLGSGDLVFYFNNNEVGGDGSLDGKDLTAWMRVCLTNSSTGGSRCWTLNGNNVPTGFGENQTSGIDDILPTADEKWAHVHSDICIADGTTPGYFPGQVVPGKCQTLGISGHNVDQSLGADEAGYAIFNTELNALLKDANSGYDVLTVDARIAHANNGGDILWIAASDVGTPPPPIPEPHTLALVGLALAGVGLARRQRAA